MLERSATLDVSNYAGVVSLRIFVWVMSMSPTRGADLPGFTGLQSPSART